MCTQFMRPPVLISSLVCLLRPWAGRMGAGTEQYPGKRKDGDHIWTTEWRESKSRRRGPAQTQLSESLPLRRTHTHARTHSHPVYPSPQRCAPCSTHCHTAAEPAFKNTQSRADLNSHCGVGGQTNGTITLILFTVFQACKSRLHGNASCENVTLTRHVYACLRIFISI